MFKSLLSLLFVFFFQLLFSQEADKLIVKSGKKYLSHFVVKGETIFRLCKDYSVTSEELMGLNPTLRKGLKLGEYIIIPYPNKKELLNTSLGKLNVSGDTSLSIKGSLLKTKVADSTALNPRIANQLSSDVQVFVPKDSLLYKTRLYKLNAKEKPDTIIQYVVEQNDVLYSIAKRFMTTVKELQLVNLKTNTSISPNSVLLIPVYDRRVLDIKFRTPKDLITEQEKLIKEEEKRKTLVIKEKKLQKFDENNQKLLETQNELKAKIEEKDLHVEEIAEKARNRKAEVEKQRLTNEQLKKVKLLKEQAEKDSISKVTVERERIQKAEVEKQRLVNEQLKKAQLLKEQAEKDSISKVTAEKARIQKTEVEKQRLVSEQLKKAQFLKEQTEKDSISKVTIERERIQKTEVEQQRLANEQLKKVQLLKEQAEKDSISKVAAEKARIQKAEVEKQSLVNEQLKKAQMLKEQAKKDSISKVLTIENIPIEKETESNQRVNEHRNTTTNSEIDNKSLIFDSAQYNKKFVLTFLLPFNSGKQNDPTSKVATEFYMGVQLALDSLNNLNFKGKVNVLDCGSDTVKLNPLFLMEEVRSSNLIIGPLNGINLIQTADFCNKNRIPMINPIMSNTTLLKNNKFVYNAVSSEMSLVKGLAKYVYRKHPKDQVVIVKVGGKDEELYDEFRSVFSNQGTDKLYEVTDTNMLSVIKKDKKSIFVVLTRDKVLASKVSKQLTEYIDRNKLKGSLTLYGTKDWINFEAVTEEVKKKIDFKYNSSIDFNSSNQNLSQLRKKFKDKFKISLTKYAAQGYDVTYYFVKNLLLDSNNEIPMMNVFNLHRIEQNSGFENSGSYVFGYEEGGFKRIQVLND